MNCNRINFLCGGLLVAVVALAATSGLAQQRAAIPAPSGLESQPPVPSSSPSSFPGRLTVAQLEQMAETHNPTLAQAARMIQAQQGQQVQVGLYPNPVIGYQAEEIGEGGQAGQQGMFFRQEIVTANKLGLNRAVASHEVQQAQWTFQMQRQRVLNDVRARAYEVLAAQQAMEIAEELSRIGQAARETAERLNQAKEVSQVDVLQARVEASSAQLQLAAARKTHAAAWRRLGIVVGMSSLEPTPLADRLDQNLPVLTWNETSATILGQSPQVAHARAGVERARCALARAQAGRTPNLETGASVRYNDDSHDTTLSVQLGMPLTIFDRNQGNIMKANAELAAAQREVERVELALQDGLAAVFRDYDIAREQVEQYRRNILPDARRSLELTRLGYAQGEFGYLELLTAQQTFSRTNLAYVERLRELWLATVQINGLLLSGGLDAPNK